ncbi:MAG: four helix bundle protein [Verrucomicrobiales bacterium]|nr:four helix bundle protein [Verrucomicrobiales bacterium]
MNYQEWLRSVPTSLQGDPLWTVEAYRLALFATDIAWHDVTKLMQDKRTVGLASQLYEAVGSVGANLSEGYSRGTGRDRARFYEYALGSARESRTWYFGGRHVLGDAIVGHRLAFHTQVIRLLLTMIPDQRGRSLREESAPYGAAVHPQADSGLRDFEQQCLLTNIPLP